MMKTCLLFLTLPFATSFSPKRGYKVSTHLASVLEDSKLEPIDFDLERAKQCAENFGSCSVEEMEMLRDALRKEHLQAFVMGHPETTAQPEEAFEHRLVEEELSLQLSLLKEQMTAKTLFDAESEAEDAVKETLGQKGNVLVIPPPSNELLATEGQMMMNLDEETLEATMICLVIAGLAIGILNI
jgi:hypothetical protein